MTERKDDYEAGLAACSQQHRRLSGLDPNHELLRYGRVAPNDNVFSYDPDFYDEAARRFAQGGRRPKTNFAGAFMLARHSLALKEAADAIEARTRAAAEAQRQI